MAVSGLLVLLLGLGGCAVMTLVILGAAWAILADREARSRRER